MDDWHSVAEKPKDDGADFALLCVIVCDCEDNAGDTVKAIGTYENGKWCADYPHAINITHWCQLPADPIRKGRMN